MARHNIDIAIRAQDEASATINRMGGLLKGGLGLFAVERAAAAAARTYQLFTLNAAQSHAALAGDAKGALEKQLEINEAWKDTLRLIPGARPLVDAFFDAFGREKEIRQTIETLNLLAVATEKVKDKAVTWGNEAEIAAAKMRGNTEAEIAFIKARQEGKGRQGDIESVQADLDKNRRALAMARANLMEQQEIDRQMSEPGWDPVRKGVNALASRVPIPGINWTSTDTLKSTVSSLEATEKDLKLTISAMEKAAVTLNRGAKGEAWNKWREEARKFDEDAQRRADEAARGAAQVARAEDEKAAVIQTAAIRKSSRSGRTTPRSWRPSRTPITRNGRPRSGSSPRKTPRSRHGRPRRAWPTLSGPSPKRSARPARNSAAVGGPPRP